MFYTNNSNNNWKMEIVFSLRYNMHGRSPHIVDFMWPQHSSACIYIYICDVDACDILWSFTHSAIKCNAARINGFHFLSSRPLWLMRSISLVHCSLLTRDGAFRHFYLRSNVCLLSHVTHASLLNRQSLFFSGFIERERNYSKVRFFWLQSHTYHMYCVWCVYYSVWRTVSLLIH